MSYNYDAAGDRTRITWPDAAPNNLYVTYAADVTWTPTYSYNPSPQAVGIGSTVAWAAIADPPESA